MTIKDTAGSHPRHHRVSISDELAEIARAVRNLVSRRAPGPDNLAETR